MTELGYIEVVYKCQKHTFTYRARDESVSNEYKSASLHFVCARCDRMNKSCLGPERIERRI
jgi:hypothetical protein